MRKSVCFGSADGKLLLTDEEGRLSDPLPATDSQEAINGLARTGDWLGVSTREDVTFHRPWKSARCSRTEVNSRLFGPFCGKAV